MGAPAWAQTLSPGPERRAGAAQLLGRGKDPSREQDGHPWEQDRGIQGWCSRAELCRAVLCHPTAGAELSQFPGRAGAHIPHLGRTPEVPVSGMVPTCPTFCGTPALLLLAGEHRDIHTNPRRAGNHLLPPAPGAVPTWAAGEGDPRPSPSARTATNSASWCTSWATSSGSGTSTRALTGMTTSPSSGRTSSQVGMSLPPPPLPALHPCRGVLPPRQRPHPVLHRAGIQLPEDGAGGGGVAGGDLRLRQHHALRQEHLLQVRPGLSPRVPSCPGDNGTVSPTLRGWLPAAHGVNPLRKGSHWCPGWDETPQRPFPEQGIAVPAVTSTGDTSPLTHRPAGFN